jgi:hypothetical protein
MFNVQCTRFNVQRKTLQGSLIEKKTKVLKCAFALNILH